MTFETINIFIVNNNYSDKAFLDDISSYPNLKVVGKANNTERGIQELNNLFKQRIIIDLIILLSPDRASFVEGKSVFISYQNLIHIAPDIPIFILTGNNCSEQFMKILGKVKLEKDIKLKSASPEPSSIEFLNGTIFKKFLQDNARLGLEQIKINLDRVNKQIDQIETNLDKANKKIKKKSNIVLDLLFWQGRKRELLAAKLLIEQISPSLTHELYEKNLSSLINNSKYQMKIVENNQTENEYYSSKRENTNLAIISPSGEFDRKEFNSQLFDKISKKIEIDLENSTGLLLEIDILKPDKKIDLFQKILKELDDRYLKEKEAKNKIVCQNDENKLQLIDEVNGEETDKKINLFHRIFKKLDNRYLEEENKQHEIQDKSIPHNDRSISPDNPSNIENKNILLNIWEKSTTEFLTKCLEENSETYIIKDIIDRESENVQEEILNKIPLFEEAFTYLIHEEERSEFILEKKIKEDKIEEIKGAKAAEIVIQNSIIKIANAIIVVILNNFVRVESVEKNLYKRSLI